MEKMRLNVMMCAGLMAASPVIAQDRETLGFGRIFNNDYFGDTQNRWRSVSYAYSIVRGPEWQGRAPTALGSVLEYRLRSEIISPSKLNGSGSNDLGDNDRARLFAQVPNIQADVNSYDAYARRVVSASKAAILRHDAA